MNILITGGAGYLGSVLVERLLSAGHRVTVLDNLTHRHPSLVHLASHTSLTFVRGDARNESLVKTLVKDKDAVIPLAAVVGASACDAAPIDAEQINLGQIRHLLSIRSPQQWILYPNTNSGYGTTGGEAFCTEDSPLLPISIYGRTKVDAEKELLAKPNTVSFRFATLFGMSPRMRLDLLVNDFVYRAVKDRFLVIFEAHFKRNYLHVRDGAEVFAFALENFTKMAGQAFNVGLSDANLSKAELAEAIKKFVPELYIHFAEVGKDPDKRNYVVSNEKINRLGFVPKRGLEDGIQELIRGYKMLPLSPLQNA